MQSVTHLSCNLSALTSSFCGLYWNSNMDLLLHLFLNFLLVMLECLKVTFSVIHRERQDQSRREKRAPGHTISQACEAQHSVGLLSLMPPAEVWPEIAHCLTAVNSMLMQQYVPLSNFRRWYSSTWPSGAKPAICNHTAQTTFSHVLGPGIVF